MKLQLASLALWASSALAFAPNSLPSRNNRAVGYVPSSISSLHAAALEPPPLSPLTQWGDRIENIRALQAELKARELPPFAPELSAVKDCGLAREDTEGQLAYVRDNAMRIKTMMQEHGAVVFRDFDLMKTQEGFQAFYAAIGMKACLDPLHSVSARPTVDGQKNSPVYEAVNKESRKNFFIGMHNEFVGTRAPRAAAFVCFKAAETGGEFLVADGRRMFRDLDADLIEELYNREIRYSVMELPFFGWIDNLPSFVQQPAMNVVRGAVSAAINAKVDFDVELLWGEGGYDGTRMLQARAPSQPPIVKHPVTGDPTWFCNVHSHSSKLRHQRESMYVTTTALQSERSVGEIHLTVVLSIHPTAMVRNVSRTVLPKSTSPTCFLVTMASCRRHS
jgi:hypothetical protein